MRYQLDKTMRFRHSGTILNCADDSILNPLDFVITSSVTDIKTGETHKVTVNKDTQLVEFTLPANTLSAGTYEWCCYLRNNTVNWRTPKVLIEVTQ